MKIVHSVPMRTRNLVSLENFDFDPSLVHVAALAADLLALLGVQRGQEILEVAIAGIEPVILKSVAAHQAVALELRHVCRMREQPVHGRDPQLARELGGALGQRALDLIAVRAICDKQSGARDRSERDGTD